MTTNTNFNTYSQLCLPGPAEFGKATINSNFDFWLPKVCLDQIIRTLSLNSTFTLSQKSSYFSDTHQQQRKIKDGPSSVLSKVLYCFCLYSWEPTKFMGPSGQVHSYITAMATILKTEQSKPPMPLTG